MEIKEILKSRAGEFFLGILNTLTDGIWISDGEGTILWVNKASFNELIGDNPEELIGKSVYEVEKRGLLTPSVTRMVIETQSHISTVQSSRSGREFLVNGHPIRDENGDIQLIIGHGHDITQMIKTNIRLEEAESLLKQYSREIRKIKVEREDNHEKHFEGKSIAYRSMMRWIDKVAEVDTTVLITGETGVGKSHIANRIHQLSAKYKGEFVHLNCGAIPESLIESELFGYKKGAFTGANKEGKVGLIKMAEGGTLFLDEIGEMPLHLQPKLLQFLQNKTYLPVGETRLQQADVRIIAATNQDLFAMVEKGKFRSDLYYRLNILPLHIPALREREEDIIPLLYFYLGKYNRKHKKERTFSNEMLDALTSYDWPGNIRELENLTERLVITASRDKILMSDLPERMRVKIESEGFIDDFENDKTLPEILEEVEEMLIKKMYGTYKSTRKTAERLGVTQSYIMRRVKRYNLREEPSQTSSMD